MESCLAFYVGTGDLNSGPRACAVSTLTQLKIPLQLWDVFILCSISAELATGPTTGQVHCLQKSR